MSLLVLLSPILQWILTVLTWLSAVQTVGLSVGWLLFVASRWWRVMRKGPSATRPLVRSAADAAKASPNASVTVIMPCKGVHTHSKRNWHSLIAARYTGHVDFVFVVESEHDAAYTPLHELQTEVHERDFPFGTRSCQVLVAGLATTTTQKITNLLRGLDAVDDSVDYVMFADDDIAFYPDTIADSVREIESDANIFCVTGAPLDLPQPGSGFGNHAHAFFRMIILLGFLNDRVQFVWGGCSMVRRNDLLTQTILDEEGHEQTLLDLWRHGGYSDDCITGAFALEAKRAIATTATHVFPSMLDRSRTLWQYVNFLHRQMFVLDTYSFAYHRFYQHVQLAINVVANFCLAVGLPIGFVEGVHTATQLSDPVAVANFQPLNWAALSCLAGCLLLVTVQQLLLATLVRMSNHLLANTARDPISHGCRPWYMLPTLWLHAITTFSSAVYVIFADTTNWAGIIYHKRNGRVVKIDRNALAATTSSTSSSTTSTTTSTTTTTTSSSSPLSVQTKREKSE